MAIDARIQYIPNYVQQLRSDIGYYIGYIPNYYADQPTQENFYDAIINDEAIYHAMNLLSLMAAGEYVDVEVAQGFDPQVGKILTAALGCIDDGLRIRRSLVYESVLMGLGVQRKYWRKDTLNGVPGLWEIPDRVKEVDRRRLRIEIEKGDGNEYTNFFWTLWCPKIDRYIVLEDRSKNPNIQPGAAVQDYIWHWNEFDESSPYGRGIGNILYPLIYIKKKLKQYWADLCETWFRPWLVAMIDQMRGAIDAELGNGLNSIASRMQEWLDLLENMRARHVAVHTQGDELRVIENGSTGENIIQSFIDWIDKKVQLVILAAELTTTAPSVGSYAMGQLHRGATQTVVQFHRLRLANTLVRELLSDFIIRNRGNFLSMGLKIPRPRNIIVKIKVEVEEQKDAMMKGDQGGFDPARQEREAEKATMS